jgi:hypothetical protein
VVLFTPEQRTSLFVTKVLNQAKVTIRHYSDSLLVTSGNADQVKIMQIAQRQRAIERLCVYDGLGESLHLRIRSRRSVISFGCAGLRTERRR